MLRVMVGSTVYIVSFKLSIKVKFVSIPHSSHLIKIDHKAAQLQLFELKTTL